MQKKWFRELFRRRMLVAFLILLQMGCMLYLIISGSRASQAVNWVLVAISLVVSLQIVSTRDKGAYKLTWVFLILLFPVFGGLLYLVFNFQTSTKKFSRQIQAAQEMAAPLFYLPGDCFLQAARQAPQHVAQMRYLQQFVGFPVYGHSQTTYFPSGKAKLERLLLELERAERYIFLEYFIVQQGVMWDSIFQVLRRKAAQGVDVRLLYDDLGCFLLLPTDFPQQMERAGIRCAVFSPFRPMLTARQNNRDHRKIISIDGKVAFTGGINLADEYIDVYEKHGRWKDAGIMIEGAAAWSFTLMFLQMWSLYQKQPEDFAGYYPWADGPCPQQSDGLVQPYADSPMDKENVGEHVYMQMIAGAKDYLYITTPYLIVDDSMVSALCLAAKSGVDVRIITPHKWDKWLVHMTTRSYYRELIQGGVRIYEYTEGFIHAKTFVSDDEVATVGTTNMDFRSLYLHFECGVWMCGSRAVGEVKSDFLQTLQVCQEITEEDCRCGFFTRLAQDVIRLVAPLM